MSISVGDSGRILGLKTLLKNLTADDVMAAVKEYEQLGGEVESFENSSTYDLVIDGNAYPPKAIFGLAASRKLKTDVRSEHFTGGENSASFKILRELGFQIVQKTERPGPRAGLVLYNAYSREDVQKILGPEDSFTVGAGTWGIQGIVRNRPRDGDAVLFVTLGNHDGNDYEDALTEDGVLIWKSQNRNTPTSPVI